MQQYLDIVRRVLERGTHKPNRTGVDSLASFSEHYVVDLFLYECSLTSPESALSPRAVNAFMWVASNEFDQYPFTPADEASMNKLLGVS